MTHNFYQFSLKKLLRNLVKLRIFLHIGIWNSLQLRKHRLVSEFAPERNFKDGILGRLEDAYKLCHITSDFLFEMVSWERVFLKNSFANRKWLSVLVNEVDSVSTNFVNFHVLKAWEEISLLNLFQVPFSFLIILLDSFWVALNSWLFLVFKLFCLSCFCHFSLLLLFLIIKIW